jgi:hypothetical protein
MEILDKTPRKSCFTGPIISSSLGPTRDLINQRGSRSP